MFCFWYNNTHFIDCWFTDRNYQGSTGGSGFTGPTGQQGAVGDTGKILGLSDGNLMTFLFTHVLFALPLIFPFLSPLLPVTFQPQSGI